MRKFLFVIALISVSFLFIVQDAKSTAPWGFVSEYQPKSVTEQGESIKNYKYYAIYKVITKQPIKYAITFAEYKDQSPIDDAIWEKYAYEKINKAFNIWIKDTLAIINKSGRAAEFKDITDILNKSKVDLQKVKIEDADIVFEFVNYKGARFVFNKGDVSLRKYIQVPNPAYFDKKEHKKLDNLLLHEIGHYYGLGDRYQEGISGSSPENSTTGDTDSDTVMASNIGTRLSCDDAEGFINLIDITLFFMNGKYLPRAEKGWNGICKNNKQYLQAREINREDFFDGNYIYTYNADGTVKSKHEAVYPGKYYMPFTETDVLNKPFTGIQKIYSADKDTYTVFDYTNLKQGYFSGYTQFANLRVLDFKALYRNKSWNIIFNYPQYMENKADKTKMKISLSDDKCNSYFSKYIYYENLKIDFDKNDNVNAYFKIQDSNKDKYEVSVIGVLGSEKFIFNSEKFIHEYKFGDEYSLDDDEYMDELIFIHSLVHPIHRKFLETKGTCRYFYNLKKSIK